MIIKSGRRFIQEHSLDKTKIDLMLSRLRGTLNQVNPKDLKNIFHIDYRNLATTSDLTLKESSQSRLSKAQQEFLIKSVAGFNSTFPDSERIKPELDSFGGREGNMISHIDHFLRTMVLVGYNEGITINKEEPIFLSSGEKKGKSDYVINRDNTPRIVLRLIRKEDRKIRGTDPELAFAANIFEMYATYWKNPIWDVYGCITDLNSWNFCKFDGNEFHRCSKTQKLVLSPPSIVALALKFIDIIDPSKE
ncbi:unnamed protein product [Blepharisma stoltei]|uniref:Restriction endonuclease n=1 Tax=Blepharisma stoltei TaxID=1481888 RepID=A0AAU9IWU9_9CILI|nr:unnamed protein product [Blepharisma stoltei]